ncbi:conserved hypothetical protein [Thermoproteus tenax Kra 1]|uniref:Heavy-metal chelation domain-containing protein n=1 Tax=Thermoproteus tenax (strain ATCC 35583 / DSM 2078 / JCM 9277 / NBRC 100435 / Kra 1) TaxID=768679 RepID=G4RMZ1_THETK|nr:conserved hypothetical protein [Thermoproteus tenax Kra 1]
MNLFGGEVIKPVFLYYVLVRRLAEYVSQMAEGLKVVDYCVCLSGVYVVVEGPRGRALGFAHVPREDLHDLGDTRPPALEEMADFVVDLHPINRTLGVAMMNAVSQYHLGPVEPGDLMKYYAGDPVCLVGNMGPLAESLRRRGHQVYVFEKSPHLRFGAYSEVEERILLPRCKTVIITGMTLLNFTIDDVLAASRGVNILTGPTAGVHPDALRGTGVHVVASMKFNIEPTIRHLKLGRYISLALHRDLGTPYALPVNT